MSSFEEYDDLVEALVVLFKEYIPEYLYGLEPNDLVNDVEWSVSKAGNNSVQWILDDLHITVDINQNKVILHCPKELGRKYLKRKVKLLWDTLEEIVNAF